MPLTLITILQTCSGSHLPSFLRLGEPSARTQAGNVFYCFPCAPVMRGSWGHAPTPAQEPQDCLWCPRPTHTSPTPTSSPSLPPAGTGLPLVPQTHLHQPHTHTSPQLSPSREALGLSAPFAPCHLFLELPVGTFSVNRIRNSHTDRLVLGWV